MLYRTDDFARWGAGKGTNLEPVEIDANFWELAQRLVAVEGTAGEAANGIANIGVVGSQMTVYLEDGTALGPYTLPVAMIHYRGDWTAATSYSELDLVAVPNAGLYLVLQDHISSATFDALAETAEGDPLYRWLFPMGGGGGAGGASVSDDAALILAAPSDINFAGAGVTVADDGDGSVTVTIPGGGGATALDDLTDVTITGPAAGQFLRYDGTVFVNAVVGWADLANVPATFPPSPHTHPWSEITGRPATVDALPAAIGANGQVLKVSAGAVVWGTDDTGGGSGGGSTAVSDEGAQILAAPSDLNFAGAGVTVTDDGDGTVTITIPGGEAGGATSLDGLSDVAIAGPLAGQFLRYDGAVFVNALVDWTDLANKPATFAPSAHQHPWGDLTEVPATFPPSAHTHTWGELTDVPATFAPSAHAHPAADIAGAVIETIAETTYTQVAADHAKWKRTTSASAVTITIAPTVNAAGDEITFQQGAGGQITFVAGTGLTLTTSGSLVTAGQGAVVGIKFLSATEAALFGQTTEESSGGGGSGDMTAAVYDPTSVAADAFARSNHHGEQGIATITGLQAALDAKAAATHTHAIADTTGLQAELDGKAPAAHTHDDRYYTEAETDALLAGKAAATHTHAIADTTGLQAALDAKAAASHTHPVTDLQTTGTPDGTKFLRDDGAWAAPAGAAGGLSGTWQDFTASRSASTAYQNTTGKPIELHIHASTSTGREIQTSPDNVTWGRAGFIQNGSPTIPQNVTVPAAHYYRINGSVSSIVAWWELR